MSYLKTITMKNHKTLTALAAAAGLLITVGTAHAQTIVNVNFGTAKLEAELIGPIGALGETWNQAGTAESDTDLTDSADGATTIDWAFDGGFSGKGDWNDVTTEEMLESAFFMSSSTVRTLTISGLDGTKTYDLYLASFDQNNWGNAEMTFSTSNTTTTVGSQVASNTLGSPWTLDNNYVVFEGLVPNGSDAIAISGFKSTGDHGMWNGFQLVEAVPEPSSFALLAGMIGLTCVMLRRRA